MPVLKTCIFEEVAIKSEGTMPRTRSNIAFLALKEGNSKTNCIIWPIFELAQDFMPVLHICKFEEVKMDQFTANSISTRI